LQKNLTQPVAQRDIAAQRFIELLIELRAVILQDVAALQSLEKYLGHPIIYHSIFEGEDWDNFAAKVLDACNAPDVPPQLVNMPPEVILSAKLLPRHRLCKVMDWNLASIRQMLSRQKRTCFEVHQARISRFTNLNTWSRANISSIRIFKGSIVVGIQQWLHVSLNQSLRIKL
jgi:hypothetical protein